MANTSRSRKALSHWLAETPNWSRTVTGMMRTQPAPMAWSITGLLLQRERRLPAQATTARMAYSRASSSQDPPKGTASPKERA